MSHPADVTPRPAWGAVGQSDAELNSAALWDLGASRCAKLPPPLEGVELHRILLFSRKWENWEPFCNRMHRQPGRGRIISSGDPCSVPWQQPRLFVHYTTASRARSIPWDVPGQPAARKSSWGVQGRQLCCGFHQVVPTSWTRLLGGITCMCQIFPLLLGKQNATKQQGQMFHLHKSLAPRFPFLERISTRSATFPSQAQDRCAVKFHKPVLLAGLCAPCACRMCCRGCSARGGHVGSLARYRISSLLNSASKCLVKNKFLSRTGASSAAFAPALSAWGSTQSRAGCLGE